MMHGFYLTPLLPFLTDPIPCICSLSYSGNLSRDDIEVRRRTTVADGIVAGVRVSNAVPASR
jgi:hypothetical protein